MKKTDLEKNKALKLAGKLKQSATPDRFATGANAALDRREQRKLDQAAGLVSFPVKLKQTVVDQLRARAIAQDASINAVLDELLEKALRD